MYAYTYEHNYVKGHLLFCVRSFFLERDNRFLYYSLPNKIISYRYTGLEKTRGKHATSH